MGGLLIGQVVGVLAGLVFVRLNFRGLFNRKAVLACLVISLPLVPHGIALQILNLGDRVIVQRDLGSSQVGRYQVAYNAAAFPIVLLTILNTAWQPKIFEVTEASRRTVLSESRNQLFRLLVPALAGAALIAPIALRILAPPSFGLNGLLIVFALVTCSAIPYAMYLTNLRTLLAFRRTANMLWATPVCAFLNILLNIWLVPLLGINGSALATLVSFAILAAVTSIVSTRVCRLPRVPLPLWIAMLAASGATFACNAIPISPVGLALRVLGVLLCAGWIALNLRAIGNVENSGIGASRMPFARQPRPRRVHRVTKRGP
jgi:O-antigen/teichoic acid export membrane protein